MKSKKGISLIVLVITIIIMIILASSTIISLSNSNIINEANKAVELTNLNQVEHIASLAWSEAYMDGKISQGQLKIAVDKALEDNKVDITKYNIEVTVNGVEVKLASETPTIKLDNTIASFNVALGGYQTSARYYEGEGKYPIGIVGGSDKASANGGIKEINFYSKKSGETDDKYVPTTVSVYPDTIEYTSIDGFLLTSSSITYILFTGLDEDIMNVLKVEHVYNDGSVVYAVYDATPIVCFVAGTKVLTETGLINIEDITAGMKVYSRNMETNQNELKEVLATSKRKVEMCTYEISVNGEKIESTGNHPFYVKGKGYVEASKLINGDILIDSNNNDHEISDIKIINNAETVTVYNLNVDDNHNYYVGQSKVLVHNAACRT